MPQPARLPRLVPIAATVAALVILVAVVGYGVHLARQPRIVPVAATVPALSPAAGPTVALPPGGRDWWKAYEADTWRVLDVSRGYPVVAAEFTDEGEATTFYVNLGRAGALLPPRTWESNRAAAARRGWTPQPTGGAK